MRGRHLRVMAAAIAAAAYITAPAGADLITFEDVPGVTTVGFFAGTPVPAGARLTDQLQVSDGVSFTAAPGYVALVLLGAGHATSGVNGIGGVGASGLLDYSPFEVTFSVPGDPSTPGVTDFVSIRGDQEAIPGTATLEAYGITGGLLGSMTTDDVPGGLTLSRSLPGIHSIRVSDTSGTIAFDDLNLDMPTVTAVPEPGSLALLTVAGAALFAVAGPEGVATDRPRRRNVDGAERRRPPRSGADREPRRIIVEAGESTTTSGGAPAGSAQVARPA